MGDCTVFWDRDNQNIKEDKRGVGFMETEGFGYLPGRFSLSKEKINKIIDILQLDKKAIKQSKI